jgi:hypothetical protein
VVENERLGFCGWVQIVGLKVGLLGGNRSEQEFEQGNLLLAGDFAKTASSTFAPVARAASIMALRLSRICARGRPLRPSLAPSAITTTAGLFSFSA